MFSSAHAHLLLNHVPIIFTALGLLFIIVALIRRRDDLARLAMGFFVGGAIFAVPTYFTGEPTEEVVEHLPGVTHTLIEQHEFAGLFALIYVGVLGLFSIWILTQKKYRRPAILPRWSLYVALIGGLLAPPR